MEMNLVLIALSIKYASNFAKILNALENKDPVEQNLLNAIDEAIKTKQLQAITILDDEYPEALKTINNPPFVIFYQGNLELLNQNPLLVIGQDQVDKNDLEKLANQPLIRIEEQGEFETQMQKLNHPIIAISKNAINDANVDANLVLSLVGPTIASWNGIIDENQLNEQTKWLGLGLSANGMVVLDTVNLSLQSDLHLFASKQNKLCVWIENYQNPVTKLNQGKQYGPK